MVAGDDGLVAGSSPTVDARSEVTTSVHDRVGGMVDAVIVSFRCREHVRRCLESLESYGPAGTRVCVIDNDFRDGTVKMIHDDFQDVDVLASDTTRGFARATNMGIRRGSAPYVLVLNPDTEIFPGTLDRLIAVLEERPEVAVAGPKFVRPDGTFDHAARRSFPTLLGALGHFTGLGRRLASGRLAQYRAPDVDSGPVDAVNGAFMLIRREALDQLGLFDEGYWMYMEDLDHPKRRSSTQKADLPARIARLDSRSRSTAACSASIGSTMRIPGGILTNGAVYLGIGLKATLALLASVLHPLGRPA